MEGKLGLYIREKEIALEEGGLRLLRLEPATRVPSGRAEELSGPRRGPARHWGSSLIPRSVSLCRAAGLSKACHPDKAASPVVGGYKASERSSSPLAVTVDEWSLR